MSRSNVGRKVEGRLVYDKAKGVWIEVTPEEDERREARAEEDE